MRIVKKSIISILISIIIGKAMYGMALVEASVQTARIVGTIAMIVMFIFSMLILSKNNTQK